MRQPHISIGMFKDITIGQYYQTESPVHRLDPRTKIIWTFVYIITLFAFQSVLSFAAAAILLVTVITVSRVPFFYVVRGMKAVAFILVFTCVFNLFLTPGQPILKEPLFGVINITVEGIKLCIFMIVRITLLIIGSSLMTLTTTPNELTDALESLLGFLKAVKVPVHELAMMMSIALRFIPILMEETDKIIKAQKARGADFDTGGVIKRAKALVPLMVPLFVSAFRRANDLAMAMEARSYRGGEGRTKMKPLRYKNPDYIAFMFLILYTLVLVALSRVSTLLIPV